MNLNTLKAKDTYIARKKIRSPFRYPGSKYQAIKFILPFWKKCKPDEYREPLAGGGAVFFALPKVKFNWLNDIDKELMTTYKIIQNPMKRKQLIQLLSLEIVSKKRYNEIKKFKPKNDMEIAFKYFYLNRTSYSGIMKLPNWGYRNDRSVPPSKWGERIEVTGKKLEGVILTDLDYHDVIEAPPKGNKVFLFVDPPYYATDQKRAYQFSFEKKDHIEVCKTLKKTEYNFCLTYDAHKDIYRMYDWANIQPASWRYHTANSNKASRKMGSELIITNF